MRYALITAGRVLLALYFLVPGIAKFVSWNMHVELMEAHNMIMVPALLAIAGIVQIGGSVCLLLNKQVVFCGLVLP